MHEIVLLDTKLVVQKAMFVCFLCWWSNQCGLPIFGLLFRSYIVDCWKCMLILLTLEQEVNGDTTNNFTKVIMGIVLQFGGLLESKSCFKIRKFWVQDGFFVFYGSKISVITQLRERIAHYILGVHYVARRTNYQSWN